MHLSSGEARQYQETENILLIFTPEYFYFLKFFYVVSIA